jgi:hypothetical protein
MVDIEVHISGRISSPAEIDDVKGIPRPGQPAVGAGCLYKADAPPGKLRRPHPVNLRLTIILTAD